MSGSAPPSMRSLFCVPYAVLGVASSTRASAAGVKVSFVSWSKLAVYVVSAGRGRDLVALGLAVRPRVEPVVGRADKLRRLRRDRGGGADDRLVHQWGGAGLLVHAHAQVGGVRVDGDVHRLRIEPDGLRVRQAARVGRGHLQQQVRGIPVVRRDERAAGHPVVVLHGVCVAVVHGDAVVDDQVPRQGRGGQRTILLVGRGAGEAHVLADVPVECRGRGVDRDAGRRLTRVDPEIVVVAGPMRVGDAQAHVVRALVVRGPRELLGRVVVLAVAVQVPRVGERVALVGVGRAGGVEPDLERGRPVGRRGHGVGGRSAVLVTRVGDLPNGAEGDVDEEQVSVRAHLHVDRVDAEVGEHREIAGVGQPVGALLHDPDALTRVVREEQRTPEGRREGRGRGGIELDRGDRVSVRVAVVGVGERDVVLVRPVRGRGGPVARRGSRTC